MALKAQYFDWSVSMALPYEIARLCLRYHSSDLPSKLSLKSGPISDSEVSPSLESFRSAKLNIEVA